jgi:hypothetical protein
MKTTELNSSGIGCIFDRDTGKELACCPFLRQVLSSRVGLPRSYVVWNTCSLDNLSHCSSHGKRLKFSSYSIDSLKVVWVCLKISDLSFLRGGDVYGV